MQRILPESWYTRRHKQYSGSTFWGMNSKVAIDWVRNQNSGITVKMPFAMTIFLIKQMPGFESAVSFCASHVILTARQGMQTPKDTPFCMGDDLPHEISHSQRCFPPLFINAIYKFFIIEFLFVSLFFLSLVTS